MNAKPTTQQLARELADTLELHQRTDEIVECQMAISYIFPSCSGSIGKSLTIPRALGEKVLSAIRAEITKEANSIKKQLQEALASE